MILSPPRPVVCDEPSSDDRGVLRIAAVKSGNAATHIANAESRTSASMCEHIESYVAVADTCTGRPCCSSVRWSDESDGIGGPQDRGGRDVALTGKFVLPADTQFSQQELPGHHLILTPNKVRSCLSVMLMKAAGGAVQPLTSRMIDDRRQLLRSSRLGWCSWRSGQHVF